MSGSTQVVVVTAGLVLAGVGLAGTAALLAWVLAGLLAVRARATSFLLAMRRLETDTGASARVVATVALLIAFSGVAQAVTATSTDSGYVRAGWAKQLPDDAVVVTPTKVTEEAGLAMAERLEGLGGVRSLSSTHRLASGGRRPGGFTLIVRTDGSLTALDRIRTVSAWSALVETPAEIRASGARRSDPQGVGKLLTLAVFFLLVVCGATVLVASVDWMFERRRTLAILSAVGVPGAVLRRSVMAQITVPLVFALAAGVTGALAVTWLLFAAVQEPVVLAGRQLATTTALAAVLVLFTTAATLPWLRIARDPELLRNE